jgi:hypothetical protein
MYTGVPNSSRILFSNSYSLVPVVPAKEEDTENDVIGYIFFNITKTNYSIIAGFGMWMAVKELPYEESTVTVRLN